MLQTIRDNAKGWLAWVIVILISIPFALWGINEYLNPNQSVAVAEVNEVEISANDYRQALQQRRTQMRAMFQNANIDLSFMEPQLKQDTLQQLINQELLLQTAAGNNMRIGDALLATHLHNYQVFQENGQFSQDRYEQLLRAQGYTPVGFEAEVRRDLLSAQLRGGVAQTAFLTDTAQQRQAALQHQQRQISYLLIPATQAAGEIELTDAEITEYYEKNIKRYQTEEQVRIEYVEFSMDHLLSGQDLDEAALQQQYQARITEYTTPARWKASHILLAVPADADEATEAAVKQQLLDLREQVSQGAAFAELAKTHSIDESTKNKGGDLGWFVAGTQEDETLNPIPPLVKNTVAEFAVGDISEPVKSQYGYHLIRLDDKEAEQVKPFEAVREALAESLVQEGAELEFYSQAEQFANLAFEHPDSLDTLANAMQLEKHSTDFFARSVQPEDPQSILANQDVLNAAFNDEVLAGYNSEVIELSNTHVLVLRVLEHQVAEPKPLDEVREQVKASLLQERQKTAAEHLAKTMLEAIKAGESPNTLAEQYALTWTAAQWVDRDDQLANKAVLVQTAFKTAVPPSGQASYQQVVLSNGDYALLALLDARTQVPANSTPKVSATDYGETQFNQLLADLRAMANIKVYEKNLE